MPPSSKTIFEEGAVFYSFKLVKDGVFQEQGKIKWMFLSFIQSISKVR